MTARLGAIPLPFSFSASFLTPSRTLSDIFLPSIIINFALPLTLKLVGE
jgi:hypothetical protein